MFCFLFFLFQVILPVFRKNRSKSNYTAATWATSLKQAFGTSFCYLCLQSVQNLIPKLANMKVLSQWTWPWYHCKCGSSHDHEASLKSLAVKGDQQNILQRNIFGDLSMREITSWIDLLQWIQSTDLGQLDNCKVQFELLAWCWCVGVESSTIRSADGFMGNV